MFTICLRRATPRGWLRPCFWRRWPSRIRGWRRAKSRCARSLGQLVSVSARRTIVALVSGSLAVGLSFADRQGYVVEYPSATWLLRWLSVSAALIAVLLVRSLLHNDVRVYRWLSQYAPWGTVAASVLGVVLVGNQEASRLMVRPFGSSTLGVLHSLTDFDGDGHSGLFGGWDCRAFDSAVGPNQREIANNGIDDNCLGGDAAAASETFTTVSHPDASEPAGAPTEPAVDGEPPRPMSVVYITVDTVGAAALNTYGNPRKSTPRLDCWAQRAVIFEEAYTVGSSTAVALGGTFRGVYPRRVQWTRTIKDRSGKLTPIDARRPLARGERRYRLPLLDARSTLPEALGEQGIQTFAVSSMHLVGRDSNVAGDFDHQVALTNGGVRSPDDRGVTKQALSWLGNLKPTDRYFMWVHYLYPLFG